MNISGRSWAGPRLILVTDRIRLPSVLPALEDLPKGSGLLLRGTAWCGKAARLAARRRLVLLVANDWRLADRLGAAGLHLSESQGRHGVLAPALGWVRRHKRLLTMACHGPTALGRARKLGVDAALLSPVFETPSHPGAPTVGPVRFGLMSRRAGLAVLALGGMDPTGARRLPPGSAAGWASIGALSCKGQSTA